MGDLTYKFTDVERHVLERALCEFRDGPSLLTSWEARAVEELIGKVVER